MLVCVKDSVSACCHSVASRPSGHLLTETCRGGCPLLTTATFVLQTASYCLLSLNWQNNEKIATFMTPIRDKKCKRTSNLYYI